MGGMMHSRKGSALLIVLGMLAFMVISAVAFSAYMRYSRLPSSFLRRTVSSRLLVKAALAEAIDEIDIAIGNNPHPGIGNRSYNLPRRPSVSGTPHQVYANRNWWKGRVYMGAGTNRVNFLEQEKTVSPLCLEALAYIPAPLVNEARYFSRHSSAATWHSLPYDAGRYAFCAIDVSDYFDVNAIHANEARSSSSSGRISLAYLFENASHTSVSGSSGTPQAWDNFMKNFTDDGKLPLISLADMNLALYQYKPSGMQSPFSEYVENGYSDFYNIGTPIGEPADKIRRMTFVTDGYFPSEKKATTQSGGTLKQFDLTDSQPFLKSDLESDSKTLYSIINYGSCQEVQNQLMQSISGLGFCQLFDYLDQNDTPLSLAIPTCERTPMICGLSPGVSGATLTVAQDGSPAIVMNPVATASTPDQTPVDITYTVKYKISGLPTAPVEALVVFPFRNKIPNENSYTIGGRMSYFLSIDNNTSVGLRTGNSADILHLAYKYGKGTAATSQPSGYDFVDDAVMVVPLTGSCPQPTTFNGDTQGEQGAVKKVTLTPNGMFPQSVDFLEITYKWHTVYVLPPNASQGTVPTAQLTTPDFNNQYGVQITVDSAASKCGFIPLDGNGQKSADFVARFAQNFANPSFSVNLKLNMALWTWIKNNNTQKIVDLVPACVYDDRDLNNLNNDPTSLMWGQNNLGEAYPLMRFDMAPGGNPVIAINAAGSTGSVASPGAGATTIQSDPVTVYVGDPRYNHAPESWFYDTAVISESTWLNKCDRQNRDGDIFMQTSDQCYLQSIYELANLPRISDFYIVGSSKSDRGNYVNPAGMGYKNLRHSVAIGTTANANYMWYTFDPFAFPNGSTPGDNFEDAGFRSYGTGFKICPYSTSTNIIMAALANTPLEWRFASTNENTMANISSDVGTFNREYAWNDYSSRANIDWEDLEDVAGSFIDEMQKNTNGQDAWEDIWADLGWYNAQTRTYRQNEVAQEYLLMGYKLGNNSKKGAIWNCDRKFLYGFWRDCFAAKQQLFLIFVRAEPTMMGGGAVGATPPQLGARAMALVWRDPTATTQDGDPHRTRILFYRQFD